MENSPETKRIVIACQGGGSHAAYVAGALRHLLPKIEDSHDRESLALVGLSGTSGGALCALLAWYGTLQGGPEVACAKLDAFWDANCAQSPGEQLWNHTVIAATAALPFEFSMSPYVWPLHDGIELLTSGWPQLATALGPLNVWGRGDYFRLDRLIAQHVDFELVAALGAFLGISESIRRWREAELQSSMNPPLAKARNDALKERLAAEILGSAREQPRKITDLMDAAGFGADSPLRAAMAAWPAGRQFAPASRESFEALDADVKTVMAQLPQLLLGAVDVGNGEFVAFSSERASTDGGISLPAVLASVALPWIYEAVPVEFETPDGKPATRYFWDGLFSQNPPIKNFISGVEDARRKPDEFWILQINPGNCDVRTLHRDISDRRNELSGNLSLNQEVSFIEAINKRVTRVGAGDHKYVQVHRIIMNSAAVENVVHRPLDSLSKSDRSPSLKEALVAHGSQQGQRFLRMRSAVALACDRLDGQVFRDAAQPRAESDDALETLGTMRDQSGQNPLRLNVDETILPSAAPGDGSALQATARWHARGILKDSGAGVQLQGESDFVVSDDSETIRVAEVRVTDVRIEEGADAVAEPPPPKRPRDSKHRDAR